MRDQGRLVEWFDDKGYGFIQPNDSTKDRVFLHIKDFSRPGPRPIVGCALDYAVILDERGRFRAQQVHYLKASQTKATQRPNKKRGADAASGRADANLVYRAYPRLRRLCLWRVYSVAWCCFL